MQHISFRISDELHDLIDERVEAGGGSASEVMRDALAKGLGMDDSTPMRIDVETLCLLRRLVADHNPELFHQAKDDAAIVLKRLGVS